MPSENSRADGQIIDMHAHLYPDGCFTEIVRARTDFALSDSTRGKSLVCRGTHVMSIPPGQDEPAARLRTMNQAGVGIQVLSIGAVNIGWAGSRDVVAARLINDGLAAICRQYPERFRFLAALPSSGSAATESELDRALSLGAVGAGITTTIGDYTFDAPELRKFWRQLSKRNLLILVHPTFPPHGPSNDTGEFLAVGYLGETAMAATKLVTAGVLEEFSGLRLVWSHCGGSLSMLIDRIDRGYKRYARCLRPPSEYLRRCHYDTACTHGPALDCVRATFGANALVYGSDEPHVPNASSAVLDGLRQRNWPAEELQRIVSGNARRLIGIGQDANAGRNAQ